MINLIKDKGIGDIDIILFVPSHRRKEAVRGYNQAELLARYIAKSLDIPISYNNLVKIKHTKTKVA